MIYTWCLLSKQRIWYDHGVDDLSRYAVLAHERFERALEPRPGDLIVISTPRVLVWSHFGLGDGMKKVGNLRCGDVAIVVDERDAEVLVVGTIHGWIHKGHFQTF